MTSSGKVERYWGIDFVGAYVVLTGLLLFNLGSFFIVWTSILWMIVISSLTLSGIGLFFRNRHARVMVITFLGTLGLAVVGFFLFLAFYGLIYEALAFLGIVAPAPPDRSGHTLGEGAMWAFMYAGFLSVLTILPAYYLCLPYIRNQFFHKKED